MPKKDQRVCSNCGKDAFVSSAISVTHHGRVVAVLCEECQQAKKIQITLEKKRTVWNFSQYFPVEG